MTAGFKSSLHAIILACSAYFLFSINDSISKTLVLDYATPQILFVSGLLGFLLCLGCILYKHGPVGLISRKWKLHATRGLIQSVATFVVITSLSTIPLADFYGIIFLAPLLSTLAAGLFLKEKVTVHALIAIAFGFLGVLIIAGPSFASGNVGYLYAFIAAIFSCIGAIIARKIGHEPVRESYAIYPFFFSMTLFAPAAFTGGLALPETPRDIFLMASIPFIVMAGLIMISLAYARARNIAMIAPFHYSQMIFGIILGFFIFGDFPGWTTLLGSSIIIGAGGMVIWHEHRHHTQIALQTASL